MKILHYSLGLPPYRTGGLTKYSVDLMLEQVKEGNEVFLLWPGKIRIFSKKSKIIKNKENSPINVYEIINPLPVPLAYGIQDIEEYTKKVNKKIYRSFLETIKPDVIHIHTLMGIHKEFFEVIRELGIRVIYTTHDFFGICPKATLYNNENSICDGIVGEKCLECCSTALTKKKIVLMQSHSYRKIKDNALIKIIRYKLKRKQNSIKEEIEKEKSTKKNHKILNYSELQKYYMEIFEMIDAFHFNSEITYNVFKNHINIKEYAIIPITHNNIIDKRAKKIFNKKLQIGYLADKVSGKGFYTLKQILDELYEEKFEFNLNIFSNEHTKEHRYIISHKRFKYEELEDILSKIDVVVVPSKWYETFGFNILEALAFGVPVITSNTVGASFLIENNKTGYVYNNKEELKTYLKELCENKQKLEFFNENILKSDNIYFSMKNHNKYIQKLYDLSYTKDDK